MSKYCYGHSKKLGICECEDCNLTLVNCAFEWDIYQKWRIARGEYSLKCKRDNPDYKPLTKKQFLEFYHTIPICERTDKDFGLCALYKQAQYDGVVEKEDRLLNES